MDKSQEGEDHQLSFVGKLSYRNEIGITEESAGLLGWRWRKVDFDLVPTDQRCPAWVLDDGEFKQLFRPQDPEIYSVPGKLKNEPRSCSENLRLQILMSFLVIL